jgi:hypothetical protein
MYKQIKRSVLGSYAHVSRSIYILQNEQRGRRQATGRLSKTISY